MKGIGAISYDGNAEKSNKPLPIVELQTRHVANHEYRKGEECADKQPPPSNKIPGGKEHICRFFMDKSLFCPVKETRFAQVF